MANISQATEQDFSDLADAAQAAKDKGDLPLAMRLDKMARQANASCTNQKFADIPRQFRGKPHTWVNTPSSLI